MRVPRSILPLLIFARVLAAAELPFEKTTEFPAAAYELVAEKRVIWLGEMHGTQEAPELLLGLIRLVAKHHAAPPIVALEMPALMQGAIDRYLASGDQRGLRSSVLFASAMKDGRSSKAMVALLTELRKERVAGVFCFDSVRAATAQERDTEMAENLRTCAERHAKAKLIVLSGNVHSRIVAGTDWDANYRPAACELIGKLGSVVSFELTYERGTMWALTADGVYGESKVLGHRWSGTAPHYIALHAKPVRGHHGVIFTRKLTGSPPW